MSPQERMQLSLSKFRGEPQAVKPAAGDSFILAPITPPTSFSSVKIIAVRTGYFTPIKQHLSVAMPAKTGPVRTMAAVLGV